MQEVSLGAWPGEKMNLPLGHQDWVTKELLLLAFSEASLDDDDVCRRLRRGLFFHKQQEGQLSVGPSVNASV